ncbi:MAG: DUF1610 domain-containing protein [Nanoarchaeota archaeon]|nr:DUF1610 domain-containing protein [Nanoarchaeota archaeon]MBU4352525.1 DUF1610 domain-containing protein [Nanoarchaeota archaeon]MBU4456878.1 DUF1610 domain-containing protein [Nanoarchaeota archaeon]MCG2719851.1 zinc finger domain-containing protein [Nanoarchaeota archaeon]
MTKLKCNSCNKEIANEQGATQFLCPNCGKQEIVRCRHCRSIASKYACSNCEFTGPN